MPERIDGRPQCGERVENRGKLVETRRAREIDRYVAREQRGDERLRAAERARNNRDTLGRRARAQECFDFRRDVSRFVAHRIGAIERDRFVVVGCEREWRARRIERAPRDAFDIGIAAMLRVENDRLPDLLEDVAAARARRETACRLIGISRERDAAERRAENLREQRELARGEVLRVID